MIRYKITGLFTILLFSINCLAQPSNSELTSKIHAYYGNVSDIVSISFHDAKIEKRWEKNGWKYYWSKHYNIKTKTEYPGVFSLSYGGVQYHKNGSSYSYDRILGGAPIGYEGIPNPSNAEINAHLKSTYDPLNFYSNYLMNYLIDAPNNIRLTNDPQWKWTKLNAVSFNVVASFTRKTDDIGGVEEQEGVFRITLQRSNDGIVFDPDAKLLNNGKWLPVPRGDKKSLKTIKRFSISKEELNTTKTLAQLNAVRHAAEFKKSLTIVDIPEFESGNHLMQFTHELLLEGDSAKITAFMYQMFPRNYFEEWSDIILNQNGESMLAEATEDLTNYSKAFCQHPRIKEIGDNYVKFYDLNKRRFNRIHISYNSNRWYITDIGYTIRQDDFTGYEENGMTYCDGSPIFINDEAQFSKGDKIVLFEGGIWRDGEILVADMSRGGYSVKYGVSGLTVWKYVNEVKSRSTSNEQTNDPQEANPQVENNTSSEPPKKKLKIKMPKVKIKLRGGN